MSYVDPRLEAIYGDRERFTLLAEGVARISIGEFLVQAITPSNVYYTAYFKKPPEGDPDTIFSNPVDALRNVVDCLFDGLEEDCYGVYINATAKKKQKETVSG
jgi:hypothetical protein